MQPFDRCGPEQLEVVIVANDNVCRVLRALWATCLLMCPGLEGEELEKDVEDQVCTYIHAQLSARKWVHLPLHTIAGGVAKMGVPNVSLGRYFL